MCSGDDATDAVMDSDVVPSAPRAGEDILSDEVTKSRVVLTDMAPPPPRVVAALTAAPSGQLRQPQPKEDMQAWRDPANIKRWVTTGRRLTEAVVFTPDMQTVLHDVVHVSPAVLG